MNDLTWALSGLLWSAVGFIGGYLFGRMGAEVHEVREAVVETEASQPLERRRRRRDKAEIVVGVVVLAMAVLTVAMSVYAVQSKASYVNCQARYNQRLAAAVKARADANDRDGRAIVDLFQGSMALSAQVQKIDVVRDRPGLLRLQREQADLIQHYLDQHRQAEQTRDSHPLPAVPTEVCR